MFEVCERDGIHKSQFVSLRFHDFGFVPSSGRQHYTFQYDKLYKHQHSFICIEGKYLWTAGISGAILVPYSMFVP
jgi:hypothetical protein